MKLMKSFLIGIYLIISLLTIYASFVFFMAGFMNRYEQFYFNYVFILLGILNYMIFKNRPEKEYALLSIEIPIYVTMFFSITLWCFLPGDFFEKIFWGILILIMATTIIEINKRNKWLLCKIATILAGLMAGYFYYSFTSSFI